jgi:hypothetical protein
MIFIFVRELIKRILKEETEKKKKDLSPIIKKLLEDSVVSNHKMICSIDVVAPWKRGPIGTHSDFEDYQIRVNVIGGLGSKNWPMTQFVYGSRDKVVNDVWHTVNNFMGLSTDVFLRNVKSCDEVLTESSNERLEKLIANYIAVSYPTAKKFRLAPRGVNGSITTFTLPDPKDEKDNLIFKFDVFGKPQYNINPEFFNSIKSLFGEKKNIKKLILKWFEDKEVDEDLIDNPINESLEDIQGMPLYHHTTESRALSIMNTNMLRGTRPDDDILAVDPTLDNSKHQSMVSFTRDKNFVPNQTIGASEGGLGDSNKLNVIFVVDKDKLKSHYKIVPFDYSALEDRWYDKRMKDEPDTIMQPKAIRTSKSNEYEERVLTNKIQPLKRYVRDIIYKGDNPLVQEKIDEFLGREKQEETEGVGAYAAPAFEMKPDHVHFKHEYNESELTERCWKGYTQKGMKTMFGKRYPNCVKIKKKRVNESKMIDYLKKFVGYKATDQKYQFQKIVDIITKITKRDNPIEGFEGVAVTRVNKDMWGQTYTDPKNVGMRWDFKVILRPLFTEYNPNNEEDYSQKVLKFEKDFLENAHGMGLGITSPIEHQNVKDYKVTFEWASHLRVQEI